MLTRDKRETQQLSNSQLTEILDQQYTGESDLLRSVLQTAIDRGMIATAFELEQACETASSLNEWPEDEGYGSSDRAFDLQSIQRAIQHNRQFLKAEQELIAINKLTDFPKVDTVLDYMAINRTLEKNLKEVA